MEPFARALKQLLDERGLEQLELATRASLSEGSISHYVNGKRRPDAETIARIAVALDLEPTYFMEYRRWALHSLLDEWIDEDEEGVEFFLQRMRVQKGPTR